MATTILFASGTAGPSLQPLDWLPSKDKLGHFLVFGLLATHLLRALPPRPGRAVLVIAGVALFGLLDETRQRLRPDRFFEWADVVADALGAVVATTLYARSRRWRQVLSRRLGRGD